MNELVRSGDLLPYRSSFPGQAVSRYLLLTKDMNDELYGNPWKSGTGLDVRYASLQADFDLFVTGGMIGVALAPYDKLAIAYLARLHPVHYRIWAIRARKPDPSIRVFGAFTEPNVFVALCSERRANLGGPGSRDWANAIANANAKWAALFDAVPPLDGENIHDFLTQNTVAC